MSFGSRVFACMIWILCPEAKQPSTTTLRGDTAKTWKYFCKVAERAAQSLQQPFLME